MTDLAVMLPVLSRVSLQLEVTSTAQEGDGISGAVPRLRPLDRAGVLTSQTPHYGKWFGKTN